MSLAEQDLHPDVIETAMIWRQRLDAPDWSAEDDARLETWLGADDSHVRAFERTGRLWDYFDQHAANPELIAARRALLGRVQRVVRQRAAGPGRFALMPSRRIAAALMGVAVLAGLSAYPLSQRGDVYSTGRGERRVVALEDGSRVSLDAESRVSVHYSDGARRLKLQKGQARFDVAHDVSRPFSVQARERTVIATGTAFNIDMLKPKVEVTLIEGRVLVVPAEPSRLLPGRKAAAPSKPVEMHAGEQLVAPNDAPDTLASVDLDEATAWQRGKLMFDQEPLGDAVAKVNRYARRKIVIADAATAAVPVSGVFEAGDTNSFLEAINGFLPVRVVEGADGVILRSAPAQN